MTTLHHCPRHTLGLLLLLFGILLSHANAVLVGKTSSESEIEVLLPDGEPALLLFWVEDTRKGNFTLRKEDEEDKKERNKKNKKSTKSVAEDGENQDDYEAAVATITITYFVSVLKYPPTSFNASERNVWLSAHFDYNQVFIPAASLSFNLAPHSWWDRKVKLSSGPPVYWYLCPAADKCAPGNPPHLLHSNNTHQMLVIALGSTSAVLLFLCLCLAALVLHLWRKPTPTRSRHWISRSDTIEAHQFTTR